MPLVLLAALAAAAAVGLTASQPTSAKPPGPSLLEQRFGPGPIEGPTLDQLLSATAVCSKTIVVNFIVYGTMTAPVSNGCWAFNRIPQNAGQNNNTFTICRWDGLITGSGPNKVIDDTNPANTLSFENNVITFNCPGTIHAQYMARRTQNSENWCSNRGLGMICWRENTISSVTRFFAELYDQQESSARPYSSIWPGNGSSGSRPTISINPDKGNQSAIQSDVSWACSVTSTQQYMSIYGSGGLTAQDENWIQGALNTCTTVG